MTGGRAEGEGRAFTTAINQSIWANSMMCSILMIQGRHVRPELCTMKPQPKFRPRGPPVAWRGGEGGEGGSRACCSWKDVRRSYRAARRSPEVKLLAELLSKSPSDAWIPEPTRKPDPRALWVPEGAGDPLRAGICGARVTWLFSPDPSALCCRPLPAVCHLIRERASI